MIGPLKRNWIEFLKNPAIFQIFLALWYLQPNTDNDEKSACTESELKFPFVKGLVSLLSSIVLIVLYYFVA
jgi:hypothetical protein